MRLQNFTLVLTALALTACQQPTHAPPTAPATRPAVPQHLLLDFEKPDLPVEWVPASAAAPAPDAATRPNPLQRSSLGPQGGLWSLAITAEAAAGAGEIRYTPAQPLDLAAYDLLTLQAAHSDLPARNGECRVHVRLTDADGHVADGDAYPVLTTWQAIPLDLRQALGNDLDISRIKAISLVLQPDPQKPPLAIKTDTWATQTDGHSYFGSSVGAPKSFFVEGRGSALHVGSVGQYEIVLSNQGIVPAGQSWLQVYSAPATPPGGTSTGPRLVLGQPNTGLYLLDQDALAQSPPRNTTPDDVPPILATVSPLGGSTTRSFNASGNWSWPASIHQAGSTLQWQVVWTSPVGAIIEGKQEAGGFDRLGEPLLTAIWRLMIYQWGEVFVDVRWTKTGESETLLGATRPVSWALMSMAKPPSGQMRLASEAAAEERLLAEVYPATFRQELITALPHRMQSNASVAMIAPANTRKDNFWWARDAAPTRWIFGTGISNPPSGTAAANGEATCMLLVNSPNGLAMAGSFGQYLVPPKIIVKQGELDRNFPGDADNDGFVESYGFQVVRLAAGRATFAIYPQERPLYYPPILFTVPAAERDALDLKHSRLLINIDGKQFANPPQFPDGSFLLQVPYVLDRPVNVEAILVK